MNMVTDGYLNLAKNVTSENSTTRISVGKQARRITKISKNFEGFLDAD